MAEHPTAKLIQRLYDRTLEGKIQWNETASAEAFQTAFPDYSVQIIEQTGRSREDSTDYILRILDADGEVVEEMYDEEFGATIGDIQRSFRIMRDLHMHARRGARGADQAVRSILSFLGADSDDDIPF